jgi:probable phosphoglycerate mutase
VTTPPSDPQRVIIEADGGSRGNPGPAAYGAVLRDADSGAVIATDAETIGIATNNVAEYSGLIAGLELANEHAPNADIEVRMDSKLVVEQMAGRWKIKHPDMRPLALKAQRTLAGRSVTWTWVPRDQNKAADSLLNAALDGPPQAGGTPKAAPGIGSTDAGRPSGQIVSGWSNRLTTEPTTFVLVRHGVTDNTERKVFCGSGGGDPGLNDLGREQAKRAAEWLGGLGGVDAVISSPLRRTHETASIIATALGHEVDLEAGFAEAAFGEWDGFTFPEIHEQWPEPLAAWLDSFDVSPPGGESMHIVRERVLVARDRLLAEREGQTVVVVSHVTPIKMLVSDALGAPLEAMFRMELAPAAISTVLWWPDGTASVRNFSHVP